MKSGNPLRKFMFFSVSRNVIRKMLEKMVIVKSEELKIWYGSCWCYSIFKLKLHERALYDK